jgi:hypothetical protein
MTLPKLPVTSLSDEQMRRRHREVTNLVLTHQHDDSRVQTSAEKLARVTPVNYAYPPGDVRRYGATGDGVTDDTAAIQRAINVVLQEGGTVFFAVGTYLVTSPLTLYGATSVKYEFVGESTFSTIIYANFTAASKRAVLELDNDPSTRIYVSFRNFRIDGISNANVSGIYCNWAGSLTEFKDLYLLNLQNGIVLANDYYSKFFNIQANSCLAKGVLIGLELDESTSAPCNNVAFFSGDFSFNDIGVYAQNALSISFHGSASEGNDTAEYDLRACEGVSFNGVYIEHANSIVSTPVAQIYLLSCTGVAIDGLTTSAFKQNGSPIIKLESCVGVRISGWSVRTTGGPFSAIALELETSQNVTLTNSHISDCSTGVFLDSSGSSEITIDNVRFANYTTPVSGAAQAHKVVWRVAQTAEVSASSFDAANIVDITYADNTKNIIGLAKTHATTVTFTNLNAGATTVIDAGLASERHRLQDILVTVDTSFDAGGDRNVQIRSAGGTVYTIIPAATLKAAAGSYVWGSAGVPFPATVANAYTPTAAAQDLVAEYQGGTTNYAAGVLVITVTATRTA